MNKALLVMDFINEIVHEDGKFAGKGYPLQVKEQDTIAKLNKYIEDFEHVIYINLGFAFDYSNWSGNNPLFEKAKEFGAVKSDTWATKLHQDVLQKKNATYLNKTRISPFYQTGLDEKLRELQVTNVYLAGVATDLVVQSAARDAHDRDYTVHVLSDACAAANDSDHTQALENMAKFSRIL